MDRSDPQSMSALKPAWVVAGEKEHWALGDCAADEAVHSSKLPGPVAYNEFYSARNLSVELPRVHLGLASLLLGSLNSTNDTCGPHSCNTCMVTRVI